jgi:orotate phosphoribosyltransferase
MQGTDKIHDDSHNMFADGHSRDAAKTRDADGVDGADLAERIARALLKIKAVSLSPKQPYTWTSGLKSPIYCDNRLTMSYPEVRRSIAEGFAALIREHYPAVEVIAGTATAGIPHAAWVAERMNLPMIYVRDKAKGHGKQNQIEGLLSAGQKVVVIEDLISTGGSSLKAAEAIRQAGGIVLGVAAIFTYEMETAAKAFQESAVPFRTLSNFSTLAKTALAQGYIGEDDMRLLESWKADPEQFGKD